MENDSHSTIPKKYRFILFIFGMSPKSVNAVENLNRLCEEYLHDDFELQVIDISREQEMAAKYQIIAIPTLIKLEPTPKRLVIGDLSDKSKILNLLEIS